MSPNVVMHIRTFDAYAGAHSVHVKTDEDLGVKFSKADVMHADNDGSHVRVAMGLGLDGAATDRIDIDPGQMSIYDALRMIQDATAVALKAWNAGDEEPSA